MKRIIQWVLAATLVLCGAGAVMTACHVSHPAQTVQTTELVRTSQSWDGVDLPDYLEGRPEIVGMKYEIPAGQKAAGRFPIEQIQF